MNNSGCASQAEGLLQAQSTSWRLDSQGTPDAWIIIMGDFCLWLYWVLALAHRVFVA